MVGDILTGLVAAAEILVYWRGLVCLIPAVALALTLFFLIPGIVGVGLAALVVSLGLAAGTIWEKNSQAARRNRLRGNTAA